MQRHLGRSKPFWTWLLAQWDEKDAAWQPHTLQERILAVLADFDPPWTLGGGAALAGVHLGLRPTRDLDLFWHGQAELGHAGAEAGRLPRAAKRVFPSTTFHGLVASSTDRSVVYMLRGFRRHRSRCRQCLG